MPPTRAIAFTPLWRIVAAVLTLVSRVGVLALAVLLLFLDDWLGTELRLGNPLRLLRAFSTFVLAPAFVGWLVALAFEATLTVRDGMLVVEGRTQRVEVPCVAIDAVLPWLLPLPSGGVWLRLGSGRRFPYGLQVADPIALIEALATEGAPQHIRAALQHSAAIHARSLQGMRRRWYDPLLRFVLFALVPALPLFRLHQWIAYGGTFGEYYIYGLQAYLLAFAVYWATSAISLVFYAGGLRLLAEVVVLATAWLAPAATPAVRRAVELLSRILYFGGVPAYLLWLFLAS